MSQILTKAEENTLVRWLNILDRRLGQPATPATPCAMALKAARLEAMSSLDAEARIQLAIKALVS
jgi:hypothetical protein